MSPKILFFGLVMALLACSPKSTTQPATTPANGNGAGITNIEAREAAERQDTDQDGANNWVDNCLQTPNPDQADGDGDGWGDACDRCPEADGKTGAHGCPKDKVPCVDACTDTQKCDMGIGDCVDLPPPPPPAEFAHLPPVLKPLRVKRKVQPSYPKAAREMRLGDHKCKARIAVDAKGLAQEVEIQGCPTVFHESVRRTLLQWTFYPATKNGTRVPATFKAVIAFRLL